MIILADTHMFQPKQVSIVQAAKLIAKIGFLVHKNMFKGQQMKIEGLLAAIAH